MKIVVIGKFGLLSKELQSIDKSIIPLSSLDYNIADVSIIKKLEEINPDIIIHSGAVTNSVLIDENPVSAIDINIIGTAHISKYCYLYNKRLVFISTDYIYPGLNGDYKESDPIQPYNNYAWTKLAGECSVKLVKDHLIIRTSFGDTKFPYDVAWENQIVTKDYIDIIAPMILKSAKSEVTGILNIGTLPKTVFEFASKRNKNVIPIKKDTNTNFSLNTSKYEKLFNNK
jgi:dTDP-4-dehydrorhamnose reductase